MSNPNVQTVNVNLPRRGSSLGVASIVLGILAFVISWIPFLNVAGMPLAALGIVLGLIGLIVALTRRGSGIGLPIAGAAVSALALIIAITITAVAAKGIGAAAQAISDSERTRNATNQQPVGAVDAAPAAAQTPTADATAPKAPATAETWAPADAPIRQGDIEVTITSVRVGKVTVLDGFDQSRSSSKDTLLSIGLELTNTSRTRKLDYRSWAGRDISFHRDYATVKDNFGNTYRRTGFGSMDKIEGQTSSASLYPGKSVTDVLVFEPPLEGVEHLDLELPGENFGGTGMIRLRIKAAMIRHGDSTDASTTQPAR